MNAPETAEEPLVSVVIACVNGLPTILEAVEALTHQEGAVPWEVVVVDCCGEEVRSAIRARFPLPQVRIVAVDERLSIPKLRAMGMRVARGRMVAILEDHCNVAPGWCLAVERAHRAGVRALGGAVENGSTERLTDWAVFFCEYARFMLPMPEGRVDEITGNNSVYSRELLAALGPEVEDEVWEAFLHARMREMGVEFHCDPALCVSHKKEFGFAYFVSQRYHYSRSFAGTRLERAGVARRAVYAAGALVVLPPLLAWRMFATVRAKGRHMRELLLSAPLIGVFLVPWAWGEAVGALLGPGDSMTKVE